MYQSVIIKIIIIVIIKLLLLIPAISILVILNHWFILFPLLLWLLPSSQTILFAFLSRIHLFFTGRCNVIIMSGILFLLLLLLFVWRIVYYTFIHFIIYVIIHYWLLECLLLLFLLWVLYCIIIIIGLLWWCHLQVLCFAAFITLMSIGANEALKVEILILLIIGGIFISSTIHFGGFARFYSAVEVVIVHIGFWNYSCNLLIFFLYNWVFHWFVVIKIWILLLFIILLIIIIILIFINTFSIIL